MYKFNDCKLNDCKDCLNYDKCTLSNYKENELKTLKDSTKRDISYFSSFSILGFIFALFSLGLSIVVLFVDAGMI